MRPIVSAPKPLYPKAKPFQMVTLTTKGGRAVTMTPESLFGLKKINGSPVLVSDRKVKPNKPMRFDFPQDQEFWAGDPRYWYLAGLMVSAGSIPTHKTHAACIHFPPSRLWELTILAQFLDDYFATHERQSFHGRHPKSVVSAGTYGCALSSKMFNMIFDRIGETGNGDTGWGVHILRQSKENQLKFLRGMCMPFSYVGFMSGVLAGAKVFPEGRIFSHHNSRLVRVLSELLFEDFGIPTELNINPHEDVVLSQRRNLPNVHSFTIAREHYLIVQDAGLAHWDEDYISGGVSGASIEFFTDPVAKIESKGLLPGRELFPEFLDSEEVAYEGFIFASEFEPNPIALDIASMTELFAEVKDREKLIENFTPTMTNRHGAI